VSVLLSETRDGIRLLTLNRPDRHNALSPELICRLADALEAAAKDDAVQVLVLTGAGERSFCSGGDLELTLPLLSGARDPETEWDHRITRDRDIVFRASFKGWHFPKPVIAAINGHCLAGGFEMMLGTDIRIAADHAKFGLPEAKHALIPFAGALPSFARQLPQAVAMEMLLTGDMVGADRLATHGLLNRVLPGSEVLPAAMEMAGKIARNGPLALAEIKRAVTKAQGQPIETGWNIETEAMNRIMASEDAREGPRAFMERRAPMYRGR